MEILFATDGSEGSTHALNVLCDLPLGSGDGPNDGIVTVEETRLPGSRHFAEVPSCHTFIMRDDRTIAMTLRFLETGTLR